MVKKNFILIIVGLFAVAFLLTGCSISNNQKTTVSNIKVVPDTTNSTNTGNQSIVNSTFQNSQTINNSSDVQIGSLI